MTTKSLIWFVKGFFSVEFNLLKRMFLTFLFVDLLEREIMMFQEQNVSLDRGYLYAGKDKYGNKIIRFREFPRHMQREIQKQALQFVALQKDTSMDELIKQAERIAELQKTRALIMERMKHDCEDLKSINTAIEEQIKVFNDLQERRNKNSKT